MSSERDQTSYKLQYEEFNNTRPEVQDYPSCSQHDMINVITPIVQPKCIDDHPAISLVDRTSETTVKETWKRASADKTARFEWGDFTAGFAAGIAGVTVGHPFDTIKVRQQVKGVEYASMWKCVKRTVKQEGILGFYKGLLFPLLTEGGRNCLFFGVNERLKVAEEGRPQVDYANLALAGAVGGAVQAVPGTPIELVKIKLQHQTEKGKMQRYFRGPLHCLCEIYSRHGFRGCFRGIFRALLVMFLVLLRT